MNFYGFKYVGDKLNEVLEDENATISDKISAIAWAKREVKLGQKLLDEAMEELLIIRGKGNDRLTTSEIVAKRNESDVFVFTP